MSASFVLGGYGQAAASAGLNSSPQGYGSQSAGMGGFGQGGYGVSNSQGYSGGEGYGSGAGYGASDYGEACGICGI